MTKSRLKSFTALLFAVTLVATSLFGVSATAKSHEYTASASYKSSIYSKRLSSVKLTGDEALDIVNVAKSQVGYHEGYSSSDFSGTSNGSGNVTEYGRWFGRQGYWCNMFVSWCAYTAGIDTSVFPKLNGVGNAYYSTMPSVDAKCFSFSSGKELKAGDLIFSCTCSGSRGCIDHVGLVVGVDDTTIYTVEGNMSDQVLACEYPVSSGYSSYYHARINYIARPNYKDNSIKAKDIKNADAIKVFGGSVYALFDAVSTFDEASEICGNMGAKLVSIDNKKELSAVSALAGKGGFGKYYIGEYSGKANKGKSAITSDGDIESVKKGDKVGFICEISLDETKAVNTAVFNGKKYEIYDYSLTYKQAKAVAEAKGGKLAQVTDNNTAMMLSLLLKESEVYFVSGGSSKNADTLLNDGSRKVAKSETFGKNNGFIIEYDESQNYTVVYDANGGENAPIEKTAQKGETIAITSALPENKRKSFLGWSYSEKAKTPDLKSGEKIKLSKNIILYAVWG